MNSNEKGSQGPKSPAERQAAYRERKAEAGKIEVRGIFAKLEHHGKIKKYAAEMTHIYRDNNTNK